MIYRLDDVAAGFDVDCDDLVVGSGAGGSVAAANLAAAGRKVVVVEAGPEVPAAQMTRDAPKFMAKHFWDGGLRMIGGTAQIPSLQARCLGGGTVVNSAIILKLPDWVRKLWVAESGMSLFAEQALEDAYARVFERLSVGPTPMAVMGRRNARMAEAFAAAGIEGAPLPRSVSGCKACADCLTGCVGGHKQSMDRTYLSDAITDGAQVFTCSEVDRLLFAQGRTCGVVGRVRMPGTRRVVAKFKIAAKRVILAAGTIHTPVILQRSGVRQRGLVGGSLQAHLGAGIVGIVDEVVEPWHGATQGWGAFSDKIPGLKYESLWAPASILMAKWGGVGHAFLRSIREVRQAVVLAAVYRGKMHGSVRTTRFGGPAMRLWVPNSEVHAVLRGLKIAADALLNHGARYVHTGMLGVPERLFNVRDTEILREKRFGARDMHMTLNHIFGSCPIGVDPKRSVADPTGRVRDVEGVYIADASLFPSASAVNPQATINALCDILSRGWAENSE